MHEECAREFVNIVFRLGVAARLKAYEDNDSPGSVSVKPKLCTESSFVPEALTLNTLDFQSLASLATL